MTINRCTKSAVFTADDEEPKCLDCDNANRSLCEGCGPDHFWACYRRSVPLKEILIKLADRINKESAK